MMRRLATALALTLLAGAVRAQDLAEACRRPQVVTAVGAEAVEQQAEARYAELLEDARSKSALAPPNHPQVVRLRYIVDRIVPHTGGCNDRATNWTWQISLVGSRQPHFHSLAGGKVVIFYGVLGALQLDDDELAALIAHAMAQALLEFDRERVATQALTKGALDQAAQSLGPAASSPSMGIATALLGLRKVRQQVLQADQVGMILAARAGYRPQAFVSLWQKLRQPEAPRSAMLDRYPPLQLQIAELERQLPGVAPIHEKAARPDRRFSPPPPSPVPASSATG